MAITVTNQTSAPALRGQHALITLNNTDSANLSSFKLGQRVTVGSSGKQGYISWLDTSPLNGSNLPGTTILGLQFKVKPQNPDGRFDSSSTPGILNAAETVTIF
jgi:hypothetical protein